MRARKKPVEIEFWIFNTDSWLQDKNLFPMVKNKRMLSPMLGDISVIETLEGDMKVSDGDYIIKGVQGEFYPCKSDIFEKTYDILD